MAESVPRSESVSPPFVQQSNGAPKAPQGSITPQGTLAVYEPGSGKLLGEVRVSTADQVRETVQAARGAQAARTRPSPAERWEEHTSELQSPDQLVCRLWHENTNEKEKTQPQHLQAEEHLA